MMYWDDVRLFLEVARAGGLAAARAKTGLSAPTLGRRMTALERTLGRQLFIRHREGYDLTDNGQELLALAKKLEQSSIAIARWQEQSAVQPVVKISAGPWTAAFVAEHLQGLTSTGAHLRIEILSGLASIDLGLRHANIGIRNRKPDKPGLAGRKLVSVAFAVYGGPKLLGDLTPPLPMEVLLTDYPWIAYVPGQTETPSTTWLEQRLIHEAKIRCTSTHAILSAAKGHAGLCVIPCFIGDRDAGLVRMSAPIKELFHDQWLVTHDDDRHTAPVRQTANALAKLFPSHRKLFAGLHSSDE